MQATGSTHLIRCGKCQATVQVFEGWVGQRVRCSACQTVIIVPPPPPPILRPPEPPPAAVEVGSSSTAILDDSRISMERLPGDDPAIRPTYVDERLVHGVPIRPLMRLINRLAELKAQYMALKGRPVEDGNGSGERERETRDSTAAELLEHIRDTVKKVQVAVNTLRRAHGAKVFPVLVQIRESDPVATDRELRDLITEGMRTFSEQYAEWRKLQGITEDDSVQEVLDDEAKFNRALAAYQQKRYADAQAELKVLCDGRPLNAMFQKFLGLSHLKLRQFDRAAVHLAVASTLGESPLLRYDLAMALFQSGQINAAVRQLRQCLTLDPTIRPAIELLAKLEAST